MGKILGIDLGTTNCCMAVIEGGIPTVIPNSDGSRTTPSVVAFTDAQERIVGHLAKRQAIMNPENTVFAVKRLIGRRYSSTEIQKILPNLPFKLTETSREGIAISIHEKDYTPEEISSIILQKLKADAEEFLGESITDAIITVPAYFDDSQRQATKASGRIAGFNVLRIINEPTAAALSYGLEKEGEMNNIIIYDFGGGTFDVSLMSITDGVFEVLATSGDTFLGGEDIDWIIIDMLADEFWNKHGIDIRHDNMALQRLKEVAEKSKCELSTLQETKITLPFIAVDSSGPKHLERILSRSELENISRDLIYETLEPCKAVLKEVGLQPGEIGAVIMVGGQTRMPMVLDVVSEFFGRDKIKKGINPDEVVAIGSAIQGGVLGGEVKDLILLDVTPLSLGIETEGGVFTKIIEKNTTIPTRKSRIFTTAVENQTTVQVKVLQGERELATDNILLATFELVSIPRAPKGIPQIEVAFDIDVNGILTVNARDLGTGKEQGVRITGSSALTEREIQRMIQEASEFEKKDKELKKLILLRNKANALIGSSEKSLRENQGLLSEEDSSEIKKSIEKLKNSISTNNSMEIDKSMEDLRVASYKLADLMYSKSKEQPSK